MAIDPHFYSMVPAGGSGTRLWPLSRADRPKFLLPLPGPKTMIQETVARLTPASTAERIFVLTGKGHADEVIAQLPQLPHQHIIVEPAPRGSGPAIALGVALIAKRDPDAIIGSFAADHVVTDQELFERTLEAAVELAREDRLVTIGITPSYAETGYGYIHVADALGERAGTEVFNVDSFREKPDLETATKYVDSGEYLWNASMFVWKASTFNEELHRFLPKVAAQIEEIAAAWGGPNHQEVLDRVWPNIEHVTVDHGIIERSERIAVVPGRFGWTDLGDWHGLAKLLNADPAANVCIDADFIAKDSSGAMIVGGKRTVAILGLDDVVVIDTEDALLICDRKRAQDVRQIVDMLKERGSTSLI